MTLHRLTWRVANRNRQGGPWREDPDNFTGLFCRIINRHHPSLHWRVESWERRGN